MTRPKSYIEPKPINPRLVTKTSLPDVRKAIALAILLWEATGKPGVIEYGVHQEKGALALGAQHRENLKSFVAEHVGEKAGSVGFPECVENNPLLASQAEALNAAFELIWHLGSVSFSDSSLTMASERTGGKRFPKKIAFSSNMDILDALIDAAPEATVLVLLEWVSGVSLGIDKKCEERLVKVLTSFAETSYYKTSKGEASPVYTPSGIYDAILANYELVTLVDPGEEAQGPTRILKSALKDGLNLYLQQKGGSEAALRSGFTAEELSAYSERAHQSIALSKITLEEDRLGNSDGEQAEETDFQDSIGEPRNLIYFGAPGTGKSYQLNKRALELFGKESLRRVTFHPDYTYAQFVGCYKPYSRNDANGLNEIGYGFVPGPFLETYIKAVANPATNYVLIIEELNRANPAAVFGDVFQLLDRDSSGKSCYSIAASADVKQFLAEAFKEEGLQEPESLCEMLSMPSNMYLWATMNSADQGVYPMDTAFKRRWEFRYMGIDDGEDVIGDLKVKIGDSEDEVSWNDLRKGINNVLLKNKVNEDKLLGPFFVSPDVVRDEERFSAAFNSKVLLYLFEDAAKTKRERVFVNGGTITYASICADFRTKGVDIFKDFPELEYTRKTQDAEE